MIFIYTWLSDILREEYEVWASADYSFSSGVEATKRLLDLPDRPTALFCISDVLALGDEQAAQVGLHVGRARFWLLAGASCMTAGCVAVTGVIGFVGLVVPHLLRLRLGVRHAPLLIGAFFGGGILLLWADVLARGILDGGRELPVGVVTSLLGGPFFGIMLRRR